MKTSFKETKEPTCWVRLKYSRRLPSLYFSEDYFYQLFHDVNIVSIILVKIGLVYVQCSTHDEVNHLYDLCLSQKIRINGVYAIYPTYVSPSEESDIQHEEEVVYDIMQKDSVPLSTTHFGDLFRILRQLYTLNENKDDIVLSERVESLSYSWKNAVPRFQWMTLTHEVKQMLPEGYNCVIMKEFQGNRGIPILLDHNMFGPSLLALLDADATSSIRVYNPSSELFYRQGVSITGSRRYTDFISCSSKTQKRNRLIILTTRQPVGYVCNCGGEFCIQRILHASSEKADVQHEFVDRSYKYFASYFATSTTKYFKPVISFINSFHNAVILDTGCGDCKYICNHMQTVAKAKQNVIIGQDNNRSMLDIDKYQQRKQCCLVQSDICNLSLRHNCFDGVLSISVLQHLPNKYKQMEALQGLIDVCKPGGRILLYVWSFEKEDLKPRFDNASKDYYMTWKLPLSSLNTCQISF